MANVIVLLVVVLLLAFALKGTIKHFKGEGPCCGGGSCCGGSCGGGSCGLPPAADKNSGHSVIEKKTVDAGSQAVSIESGETGAEHAET